MQNITQPKRFPPREMCEQHAEKQPARRPWPCFPGCARFRLRFLPSEFIFIENSLKSDSVLLLRG